ncbi:M16 family metallopeptidase [Cystobacter fuscus]|uniref:M16 family metallopeptidase n=1 Tax=Cystobacter fuscus TaxID=43 RepID=UPI003B289E90
MAEQLSSLGTEADYVIDFRRDVLPYLAKTENRPEARAARAFEAALYPEHAYGRSALAADLQKVGEREIEDWLARTYRPANAVVAIVGELDLDEAEKQVRTWLSGWTGPKGEPSLTPPPVTGPARAARLLLTAHPGATQTWVSWGCPLPPADAATEASYELMAQLASRRLHQQVRAALGAPATACMARAWCSREVPPCWRSRARWRTRGSHPRSPPCARRWRTCHGESGRRWS